MNPKKNILILAANPKNTNRLRLDEEVREIVDGLQRSKYRDQFLIQSRWAIRLRDLRRALLDYEPLIVHFCGHGEENGIVVEDEQGNATIVSSETLSGLFNLFADYVECVMLNACYSQTQAEAINDYIPYIIGLNKGIQDKTAIEFAVGFYDAIGAGKSFEEAFEFGCNAIQLYNLPEHLIPVIQKRDVNSCQPQPKPNKHFPHKMQLEVKLEDIEESIEVSDEKDSLLLHIKKWGRWGEVSSSFDKELQVCNETARWLTKQRQERFVIGAVDYVLQKHQYLKEPDGSLNLEKIEKFTNSLDIYLQWIFLQLETAVGIPIEELQHVEYIPESFAYKEAFKFIKNQIIQNYQKTSYPGKDEVSLLISLIELVEEYR